VLVVTFVGDPFPTVCVIVIEFAFVDCHVRLTVSPDLTELLSAWNVRVGAGFGFTVSVAVAVAGCETPSAVAVIVYVVVWFGLTVAVPLSGIGSAATGGVMCTVLALVVDQVSVAVCPAVIVVGSTLMLAVGAGGGVLALTVSVAVAVAVPPAPVAVIV
jgi:hypothetical protein